MKMNSAFAFIVASGLALGLVSSSLEAGSVISSAAKMAGNATEIALMDGGLAEGVPAYTDRTHALVNIPSELIGSDLIQVSNDDKSSNPYQIDVTLPFAVGLIYVGLDNRMSDNDSATRPPALPWMSDKAMTGLPDIFYDTGRNIDIDEGNDGTINQTFSLFVAMAPAGTYSLMEQDFGGNNYIAFGSRVLVVPEPSSLVLFGLGGLVAMAFRRRRA